MAIKTWGGSAQVGMGEIRTELFGSSSLALRNTMQNIVYPRKGVEEHSLGYFRGKSFVNFYIGVHTSGDAAGETFSYSTASYTFLGNVIPVDNLASYSSEANLWFDLSGITSIIIGYEGGFTWNGWYESSSGILLTGDSAILVDLTTRNQIFASVSI